ncbi:MAG: pilus assembly protein, partial [Oxalobacteraceae bacterium]
MTALSRRLRALGHAGTALIEFALTAPILVTLLLSVADLAPSLMVKFKVGTATQAVADLAAQTAT